MTLFKVLKTPLPIPKRSLKKFLWIVGLGLGGNFFILLFNPFEIANQAGESVLNVLLLFSLGLIFSLAIIFMEWVVPSLVPRVFQRWNIGKALVWYALVTLFTGAIIFFYKSYLGGFRDFTLTEFFLVLLRILVISVTVAFVIVGALQILNRRKLSLISSGESFQITSGDGKTFNIDLNDILYVTSDDNYVDIHYQAGSVTEKHILRSSLKNIEEQIVNPISPIVRCHRQFLINVDKFEIKKATSRSMTLFMKNLGDEIPVSSRYVESVKKRLFIRP